MPHPSTFGAVLLIALTLIGFTWLIRGMRTRDTREVVHGAVLLISVAWLVYIMFFLVIGGD